MKLLLLVLLTAFNCLGAAQIYLTNKSEFEITDFVIYTPTTFNNSLQHPLLPHERMLIAPNVVGTFGVYIAGPGGYVDFVDIAFNDGEYEFYYQPPDESKWSRKLTPAYGDSGCTASDIAGCGITIPLFILALLLTRRRQADV